MSKRIFNIINYIPIGKENAISMPELSERTGRSQREVRKAVFNARCKGAVICSTCSGDSFDGYYFPASVEEALPYVRLQKSRMRSARQALKSAEKFIAEAKEGR